MSASASAIGRDQAKGVGVESGAVREYGERIVAQYQSSFDPANLRSWSDYRKEVDKIKAEMGRTGD